MTKSSKSPLARISALLLAIALVVSAFPIHLLTAQAEEALVADAYGTVTGTHALAQVDSTIESNITVTYESMSVPCQAKKPSEGREKDGWYLGAVVAVPDTITDTSKIKCKKGDEDVTAVVSEGKVYLQQDIEDRPTEEDLQVSWKLNWNGNETYEQTITLRIIQTVTLDQSGINAADSTAPKIATISSSASGWTNEKITISGTVTDNLSGVDKVYYKKEVAESTEESVTVVDDAFTIVIDKADYAGKYKLYCKDKAGNKSEEEEVAVQMDTTAPILGKLTGVPSGWTNQAITIEATATDALSGVDKVYFKKGDATPGEANLDASTGQYSFTIAKADYEGKYTVYCQDKAGNKSAEKEVTVCK